MKKLIVSAFLLGFILAPATQATDNLTVALHRSCPGGQEPETVPVAAILGKLVLGFAADWVGAVIKAQASEQSATLGTASSEAGPSVAATRDEEMVKARIEQVLHSKPNQTPLFYADFEIVSLPTRQDLFALRTLTLYLGKSGVSGWTNHERSVAVALSFHRPGDSGQAFASTKFQFPNVPIGKFISRDDEPLFKLSSGWLQSPSYSDAEKDTAHAATNVAATNLANQQAAVREKELNKVVGIALPAVSQTALAALKDYCASFKKGRATPKAPTDLCPPEVFAEKIQQTRLKDRFDEARAVAIDYPVPVPKLNEQLTGLISMTVAVSETRDASRFWAAMSSAYDSQKTDLTQAIARKLIPSDRRAAEAEEKNAAIEAENATDDKRILLEDVKATVAEKEALVAALTDKSADTERVKANAELTKAKIRVNQGARLARITPLPYPELDY